MPALLFARESIMGDKSITLNKEVGVATAIGAGLGVLHGLKNNNVVGASLLGAGVGALVGLFGNSLLNSATSQTKNEPETTMPEKG